MLDDTDKTLQSTNFGQVVKATIDTMDDATAYVMKYSDIYVSFDKYIKVVDDIQFGLWMNISKKRLKQVEFETINVTCELALKGMTQKDIAVRVMQISFDTLTSTAQQSLRFIPIGGVIYIETLDIPPVPINKSGFKMRESLYNSSSISHSLIDIAVVDISHKVNRVPYQDVDWEGNIEEPSTQVSFIVASNVLIRNETPFVGWWDSRSQQWKLNGITGTIYDSETRKIEFATTHLTTALAIVQVGNLQSSRHQIINSMVS